MEMLQMIVLLCQINHSKDYAAKVAIEQHTCQKYYVLCTNEYEKKYARDEALKRCMANK
jgi:hypothetical protein